MGRRVPVAGIEEAGFDFAGSPFGRDRFDFFPFESSTVRYQDVFDGFVFYRPLSEHRLESGIPGLFDDGFEAEAKRRIAITGRTVDDEAFEALVGASVEPWIELYDRPEEIEAMISRWIDESPAEGTGDSNPNGDSRISVMEGVSGSWKKHLGHKRGQGPPGW